VICPRALPDAEAIALVLFGRRDDIPVMGDWSGSATLNIGVFRNGQWLLDCNGQGVFGMAWPMFIASTPPVRRRARGGRLERLSHIQDLSGSGKSTDGVFRSGCWIIDMNGNGLMATAWSRVRLFRLASAAATAAVMRQACLTGR
jgi:hypothetical protein